LRLLQRSAAGVCLQSAEDAATAQSSTALLFGEDAIASCYEAFSHPSDLEEWCQPTSPPELPLLAALNLSWSSAAAAYVGAYGDAHPGAPADWTALEVAVPSSGLTREWHAPSQTCRNVLSMMEVQVLYAQVGFTEAPVRKVLGVRLVLTAGPVAARRCTFGANCSTLAIVSAATSFVELPKEGRAYTFVPPIPELLPDIPADFFNPFVRSDDRRDSTTAAQGRRQLGPAAAVRGDDRVPWRLWGMSAVCASLAATLGRRLVGQRVR